MSRVTNAVASRNRRKKVLASASGYWGRNNSCFRLAKRIHDRAMAYQYRDRRQLKRRSRTLNIQRINAWARLNGLTYATFMSALKNNHIELNRQILARFAFDNPEGMFTTLLQPAECKDAR